ncbi:MAG: MFS transporter [Patescibacteria group bacterium]|nr:MFS transporter [Patescibacteria group bacterium]
MNHGAIFHRLEHYLALHPEPQVKSLFAATAILDFATALVSVFEPLYLYSLGYSVPQIILFFGFSYLVQFFIMPLGGRICRRGGYEHTLLYSSPFLVLYYLFFYAMKFDHAFLFAALIVGAIYRTLYWLSHHSVFASWSHRESSSREFSNLWALGTLAASLGPVFGGAVIEWVGYPTLFVVAVLIILVANLPLLRLPDCYVPQPLPYWKTFRRLLEKKERRRVLAFFGVGERIAFIAVWPLFVVSILQDTMAFGALISLSLLVTTAATLYIGRVCDTGGRKLALRGGTLLIAGSYFFRAIVTGGFGAFLSDAWYRIALRGTSIPLNAMMYDDLRGGEPVERVLLYETASAIGRFFFAVIAAAVFWLWPNAWSAIFIMAALFSLLYALMEDKRGDDSC